MDEAARAIQQLRSGPRTDPLTAEIRIATYGYYCEWEPTWRNGRVYWSRVRDRIGEVKQPEARDLYWK